MGIQVTIKHIIHVTLNLNLMFLALKRYLDIMTAKHHIFMTRGSKVIVDQADRPTQTRLKTLPSLKGGQSIFKENSIESKYTYQIIQHHIDKCWLDAVPYTRNFSMKNKVT